MTTAPRSNGTISNTENVRGATTLARAARDTRPDFLKPSEIATRLRVCKMTVYRLIDEGAFPGTIRVGKSIRVPYSAFEAYVKGSEVSR